MIKNASIRRIIVATFSLLLVVLTIYLFPQNEVKIPSKTIHKKVATQSIYLLDNNNYVAMSKITIDQKESKKIAYEIIDSLIKGTTKNKYIPDGFRSPINELTKVNSIEIDEDLVIIDFSSTPFLKNGEFEEKTIEAIVFSLTEIKGINKVLIKVNGEILEKLPSSGKIINNPLTRKIGINHKVKLNSLFNSQDVTTYFINYNNNEPYYIPVTLTTDNRKEKIEIIIEELSGKDNIDPNLKTYLEAGTILKNYEIIDNEISLEFNNVLLNGLNEISEEVIYGLSMSIKENYDLDKVVFSIDNHEISSFDIKTPWKS